MNSISNQMIMSYLKVAIFLIVATITSGQDFDCNNPPIDDIDPETCCTMPALFDDDAVSNCEEILGFNEDYEESPEDICLAECLMNSTAKITDSIVLEIFIASSNDENWTALMPSIVSFCLAEAAKKETEFKQSMIQQSVSSKPKICNPESIFIIECAYLKMFMQCPVKKWRESQGCTKLRNFITNCSFIPDE